MASYSGQAGDGSSSGTGSRKKHPLIHDHLKPVDPANAFSIDRTFSSSSTDVQPSFDIFDDVNDEDEDDRGRVSKRKLFSGNVRIGNNLKSRNRAEMYRMEMASHRAQNHQRHCAENESKSKQSRNTYYNSGSNFAKTRKPGDDVFSTNFYVDEAEDSIGEPSDISGMFRDSEAIDEYDEEQEAASKCGETSTKQKGNNDFRVNNNGVNSTSRFNRKDNGKTTGDIDVNEDDSKTESRSDGEPAQWGDFTNSHGETSSNSGKPYGCKRANNTGALRSSIISDGRFGSLNSVSSSFNSAAAAAIGSSFSGSSRFGAGALVNGGHNSNDILNERLERFQRYTRGPYAPLDRCNSTSVSSAHSSTITQHYYPEGGWGYVVLAVATICHSLMCGLHLSAGVFILQILNKFGKDLAMHSVWLVSFSMGTSLFLSPIWVSICTRRSTRLTAVLGGLVTSLACLFTSFASQFHQVFISFGIILSIGIGLSRDASYLMVGQYFKRRRDFVEVFLVAGSGLGILVMTLIVHSALSGLGWRFGLQALTVGIFSTFFLATCYRSASLYHPQRRAILHLKNQKRKIKEKGKQNDRPPFLDCSCLSSRSIQLLVVSTTFTSFGCYSPLFHLALDCAKMELLLPQVIYFYVYLGAGWILGSCLFGITVHQRNEDCRISTLYLLQGSTLIIAGTLFALATVYDDHGLGSFCWIYGFGLGSYNYTLKAWTYEKMRAKNFARAWSFIQSAQGLGCIFGVPATGYMNYYAGWRTGYFMSSASVFFSAMIMCCCGMKRGGLMRNKSGTSSMKTCETFDSSGMQSPATRRISFTFPDEQLSPRLHSKGSQRSSGSGSFYGGGNILRNSSGVTPDRYSGGSGSINSSGPGNNFPSAHHHHTQQPLLSQDQPQARPPKELTCISEEGALEPHGPV